MQIFRNLCLRPIPVINDVSLEKSSSNLEERVDSFYEFPTAVNVNVNKTTAILPKAQNYKSSNAPSVGKKTYDLW